MMVGVKQKVSISECDFFDNQSHFYDCPAIMEHTDATLQYLGFTLFFLARRWSLAGYPGIQAAACFHNQISTNDLTRTITGCQNHQLP